jgi:hypothetical protein
MPRPKKTQNIHQEHDTSSAWEQLPVNDAAVLKLSKRASIAFAELLLNPSGPNQNAMEAAKRYMARVAKGEIISEA